MTDMFWMIPNFLEMFKKRVIYHSSVAKKNFFDRLENKQFTINFIALLLIVLFGLIFIIYCIASWKQPDKIYSILINMLILGVGLLGGKSLGGNTNDN